MDERIIRVAVEQVYDGGHFLSRPTTSSGENEDHSTFLAALNNHYNVEHSVNFNQVLKKGEIYAVYCDVDASGKLWHRGRIIKLLKKSSGYLTEVLLVDEGNRLFVPGKWLRKLHKKFQQFPIQQLDCRLYGLVPWTYVPSPERLVVKQTAKQWDISAKKRLFDLVNGEVCIMKTHFVDSNGAFHVTLIVQKKKNVEINVNECFVQEEYAVFEEPQQNSGDTSDADFDENSSDGKPDSDMSQEPLNYDIRKNVENIENERLRLACEELSEALSPSEQKKYVKKEMNSCNSSDQTSNSPTPTPTPSKMTTEQKLFSLLKGDTNKSVSFLPARLPASKVSTTKTSTPNPGKSILKKSPNFSSVDTCESTIKYRQSERQERFKGESSPEDSYHIQRQQQEHSRQKQEPSSERNERRNVEVNRCFELDDKAVKAADLIELKKRIHGDRPSKGYWASSSDDEERTFQRNLSDRDAMNTNGVNETNVRGLQNRIWDRNASGKRTSASSSGGEDDIRRGEKRLSDSNDLLRMLGAQPSSFESEQKATASSMKKSKDKKVSDDVLVWGKHKPKCFSTIEELKSQIQLRSAIKAENIINASPLQSYLWPAIMRGRDVVGIAAAKQGKTTGCLIPVLTMLVEEECYADLPMGNGPCVIVLVPDWRTAVETYNICNKFVACYRGKKRAQVLYGGRGTETDQILAITIINGCEILISTVPALIKMLRKEYTNLDRLCHLIFDNADVLVEDFTEEIKEFMKLYAKVLSGTLRRDAPHQIIAMATEWSYGLSSLVRIYFDRELVIVANKLEAAVFIAVKQIVEICSTIERLEHVTEFIDSNGRENNIIIFTKSAKECENLEKLLNSQSIAVLLANEYMEPIQLKEVRSVWEASIDTAKFVLVMTDAVAVEMGIRNASCIIHYEFPDTKNALGNRLNTMLDTMRKQESKKDEEKKECLSILLITEKNELHTTGIVKLMKRAGQDVPVTLVSIADRAEQMKEEKKKSSDICKDLKRFGKCRDKERCKQRHTLFADVDMSTTIPICGVVKIVILDVISATVFWGRITEHRLPTGTQNADQYDTESFIRLTFDMQLWFAEKSKRIRLHKTGHLQVGDMFVVETKQGFQRARVKAITKKEMLGNPLEVKLFGIDCALKTTLGVEKLLLVPEQFADIPPQAIEMIICGVKPVDKSSLWTAEACATVSQLVAGKILEGKITLSLRNTLWLDPVIEKVKLEELSAVTTALNVGEELLKLGFAERNSQHVTSLKRLCEDVLPNLVKNISKGVYQPAKNFEESLSLPTLELCEDDFEQVYVSAVETPGVLFVQPDYDAEILERLEEKIEAVMAVLPNYEDDEEESDELSIDSYCVAQFTDDKWYRGKIIATNSSGEFDIYFVDHGDSEWVSPERVKPAWLEILELPLQAIECSLAHIKPIDTDWTEENGDVLWDLTKDKLLYAKVVSKEPSFRAGSYRYNIVLYDTTQGQDVKISHELIMLGHAEGFQQCIQEMFPDALWCPEKRDCQYEYERISDLCLQIYRCQNIEEKLTTARRIQKIMMTSSESSNEIMESGGLKSLCHVLGLSTNAEVQEILSVCIVYLAKKDNRVSEEVMNQGGLKVLCNILAKAEKENLQEQIIWALTHLGTNDRNKDAIRIYGGITTLCRLLESSSNPKILAHICEAIKTLCKENDQNCTQVRENSSALRKLCDLLQSQRQNGMVLEACTGAISELVVNTKNRDVLRDIGAIDIFASFIQKAPNDKCLENLLKTLKTLTNNNQLNQEYVRNIDIVTTIERITSGKKRCSITARRLCSDLLSRLKVARSPIIYGEKEILVPKLQVVDEDELPPLVSLEEDEERIPAIHPKTVWSQRRKAVTISVQLRGVRREETNISENRVSFKTSILGKRYELDFELYKPIIPTDSRVNVHGGEVLIVLIKKEHEVWSRLLKMKEKPPYLSIDFDRWADDLSSDGDDESDTGINKRQRSHGGGFGEPPKQSKSKKGSDQAVMFPDLYVDSYEEPSSSEEFSSDDDFSSFI